MTEFPQTGQAFPWSLPKLPKVFCLTLLLIFFAEFFFMLNPWHIGFPDPTTIIPEGEDFNRMRSSNFLGWEFIPNTRIQNSIENERINSEGWRGIPPRKVKNPQSVRIACLGDSVTFGLLTSMENKTWPRLLERKIRHEPFLCKECEVLNFGVNGYGTFQGAVLSEKSLASYQTDIALMMYGWNDAVRIVGWFDHHRQINYMNSFLGRSPLIRKFLKVSEPWIREIRYSRKVQKILGKDFGRSGAALPEVRENLKRLIFLTRKQNIQLVIMTTPYGNESFVEHRGNLTKDSIRKIQAYNDCLRSAAGNTTAILDLERIFNQISPSLRGELFFDDGMHLTAKGGQVLADAAANFLALKLIKTAQLS